MNLTCAWIGWTSEVFGGCTWSWMQTGMNPWCAANPLKSRLLLFQYCFLIFDIVAYTTATTQPKWLVHSFLACQISPMLHDWHQQVFMMQSSTHLHNLCNEYTACIEWAKWTKANCTLIHTPQPTSWVLPLFQHRQMPGCWVESGNLLFFVVSHRIQWLITCACKYRQ